MKRTTIGALTLSAAALVGIAVHEGYRDEAYIPVRGDRPTIGFGDAGPNVQMGQRTDPVRALIQLNRHVSTFEREMKSCLGDVPLYQHEWDAYVSFTYNVGSGAFCRSTLVRLLKEDPPRYAEACAQLLRWTKFQGRDLPGLVKRRQDEHRLCMGEK